MDRKGLGLGSDTGSTVWCWDITYIWTIDGFVYLTSVMDLFSRKIIAWTISETLEVSCVIDTINRVIFNYSTVKLPRHFNNSEMFFTEKERCAIVPSLTVVR